MREDWLLARYNHKYNPYSQRDYPKPPWIACVAGRYLSKRLWDGQWSVGGWLAKCIWQSFYLRQFH